MNSARHSSSMPVSVVSSCSMYATAAATIGATAVLCEVNWLAVVSSTVLAGILSLLTSLAGLPELEE